MEERFKISGAEHRRRTQFLFCVSISEIQLIESAIKLAKMGIAADVDGKCLVCPTLRFVRYRSTGIVNYSVIKQAMYQLTKIVSLLQRLFGYNKYVRFLG
ncbi:hypothetical protein [Ralstonia pseudosolanacearum]|uniref:hypothetical protein n=1 Tax=Ralstonia pseudosolanacearum TaxID=1310165 RepID=UPI001FF943F0|nr:hypothetical protein [Ralstonia pseudosolanacearum]